MPYHPCRRTRKIPVCRVNSPMKAVTTCTSTALKWYATVMKASKAIADVDPQLNPAGLEGVEEYFHLSQALKICDDEQVPYTHDR